MRTDTRTGTARLRWPRVLLYVVLAIIAIPFLFPTWWMITSSFKTVNQIFAYPPSLIPTSPSLAAYVKAFSFQPFARQYFNSMYIAVLVTVITMLISSMASAKSFAMKPMEATTSAAVPASAPKPIAFTKRMATMT